MKIEQINITRCTYGKWIVEIVEGECQGIPTTDAWLYCKDYSIKMHCFGTKGKASHEEFDIIEIIKDYKEFYKKEYMID